MFLLPRHYFVNCFLKYFIYVTDSNVSIFLHSGIIFKMHHCLCISLSTFCTKCVIRKKKNIYFPSVLLSWSAEGLLLCWSVTEPPRSWNRLTVWAGPECSVVYAEKKQNRTPLTSSALVMIFIMMLLVWTQLLWSRRILGLNKRSWSERDLWVWLLMQTRAAEMKLKQQSWKSEIQGEHVFVMTWIILSVFLLLLFVVLLFSFFFTLFVGA